MGMAASQARLLSITSRMSDNELRAQLINNAKMRLTTDSSRVSDEYIAALNETRMMFSNFDVNGNEQSQGLTFNSLTAYSSYNSQYGIVSNAGQLMVSKTDAANFEKASGLSDFLACYGLEQSKTTYFDKYATDPVGYYDEYGVWQDLGVSVGDMKNIYEGTQDANGIDHYGYASSINSAEYHSYNSLVADYQAKKDDYKSAIKKAENSFMDGNVSINGKTLKTDDGKTFETVYNEVKKFTSEGISDGDITTYTNYMYKFLEQLGLAKGNSLISSPASRSPLTMKDSCDVYLDSMRKNFSTIGTATGTVINEYEYSGDKTYGYAKYDEAGNFQSYVTSASGQVYISDKQDSTNSGEEIVINGKTMYLFQSQVAGSKPYNVINYPANDTAQYKDLYYYEVSAEEYDANNGFSKTDADGNAKYYKYTTESAIEGKDVKRFEITDSLGNSIPCINNNQTQITKADKYDSLMFLYDYFKDNTMANLDENQFINGDETAKKAQEAYYKAAQNLATFIYGTNGTSIDKKYYDYLDDPSWVLSQNHTQKQVSYTKERTDSDGNVSKVTYTSDNIDRTHYNPYTFPTTTTPATKQNIGGAEYTVSYQAIKDAYLINCMLNQYGTPTYTWIDKNNPDKNADAKAQWYTNLYERMAAGYKEMPENLMNSEEWIKFAFESGLVHMEQVDKSNKWTSTMYSNCSNITESTVDVDVTIAEAKYKKEMNKIEAKDKQYDLELKNIDTEHSSLQTEYESIKSVIDKNVERNFKMFQA